MWCRRPAARSTQGASGIRSSLDHGQTSYLAAGNTRPADRELPPPPEAVVAQREDPRSLRRRAPLLKSRDRPHPTGERRCADGFAHEGAGLAGATAEGICEEQAAAAGGPRPRHAALEALGYNGISELLRYRPARTSEPVAPAEAATRG